MMSHIQAVLFDKDMWSTGRARRWLMAKGYQPIKRVHTTKKYYRYRLVEPSAGFKYRMKVIGDGIRFVMGVRA